MMRRDAMVRWRVYGLECELLWRQHHGGSSADVVFRVGAMCHTATQKPTQHEKFRVGPTRNFFIRVGKRAHNPGQREIFHARWKKGP
eukprot:scaffold28759_cov70-Cyclotella_meneghiniana.AAC.3